MQNLQIDGEIRRLKKKKKDIQKNTNNVDLRSILNLDGADLVEAPLHDVLALQHELTALSLEVLLLPDCDLELAHLLHLLSVHGCCFSLGGYSLTKVEGLKKGSVSMYEKSNQGLHVSGYNVKNAKKSEWLTRVKRANPLTTLIFIKTDTRNQTFNPVS